MKPQNRLPEFYDRKLCQDVYADFSESIFSDTDGRPVCSNPEIYSIGLFQLVFFVDDLTSTPETPFIPRMGKKGRIEYHESQLASRYFSMLPDFVKVINWLSDRYTYCEQIEVFISTCRALNVLDPALFERMNWWKVAAHIGNIPDEEAKQLFNQICERIRNDWVKEGYKARYAQRKSDAKKCFKEYSEYPLRLFEGCAGMVLLRVDLGYRKEISHQVTLEDLQADIKHLLANKRGAKVFRFIKGYIVKLEYGIDKGVHAHFLIFLDGSKRKGSSHVYLAQMVGEYWVKVITRGRGAYWNCNAEADNYERLNRRGIGKIHRSEGKLISNLQNHVIAYLCKMDQFIRPKHRKEKMRLIHRGQVPKKNRGDNTQRSLRRSAHGTIRAQVSNSVLFNR